MTLHACDRADPLLALMYESMTVGLSFTQGRAGLLATASSPLGHRTPLMISRADVRAMYDVVFATRSTFSGPLNTACIRCANAGEPLDSALFGSASSDVTW